MTYIFFFNGQKRVSSGSIEDMPQTKIKSLVETGFKRLQSITKSDDLWCQVSKEDADTKYAFDSKTKKAKAI